MQRSRSLPFLRYAGLALFLLAPSVGHATVTVYTSQAGFQAAAAGAALLVDFESRNGVQSNPFTDHTGSTGWTRSGRALGAAVPSRDD